jgi:hypothetical protein
MENCQHGNFAPIENLEILPVSQAGIERHKCVICAYQGGFRIGIQREFTSDIPIFQISCKHGKTAPEYLLRGLPESQAGTGRHKCAICAFYDGLLAGIEARNQGILLEKKIPSTSKEGIQKVDIPDPSLGVHVSTTERKFIPKKDIDYLKIHTERTSLGFLAEQLVIDYERNLLIKWGLKDLASNIVHTSVLQGDGAGYDILSFGKDGENKYIEVKATKGKVDTPFFMSANEVEFSKQYSSNYYLYRVFELKEKERQGKFYLFQGDVSTQFRFNPIEYQVVR